MPQTCSKWAELIAVIVRSRPLPSELSIGERLW
jgi:hypothetical protein